MFLGEFEHSLDAKGRVILPSKFRLQLSEGCVLAKGQEHCLYLFPKDEWDRLTAQLGEERVTSRPRRDFLRLWFAGASEQTPDGQGRVSIPEPLRRYAALERDVIVAGVGRRLEIWDRAAWRSFMGEAEQRYSEVAESHPDLPL